MQKQFKLQTGDVITAKSEDFPLIEHQGVVVYDYGGLPCVVHNVPEENVTKDLLVVFLARREIISVEKTGISREQIMARFKEVETAKYDLIHFNCTHFVKHVIR